MKLPRLWRLTQEAVYRLYRVYPRSPRYSTGLGRGYPCHKAYFSDTRSVFPSASVHESSPGWRRKGNTAGEKSDFLEHFINSDVPPQAALDHFNSSRWTASYLQDPGYQLIPFFSRQINLTTGENLFFAQTINTPTTIPHVLASRSNALKTHSVKIDLVESAQGGATTKPFTNQPHERRSTKVSAAAQDTAEVLIFLHLGTGLDAHPSIIHGGLICVLFDEAFRLLILLHQNISVGVQPGPRDQHFTVQLNTSYRAPIFTPTDVLVKCWLVRREGRKWFTKAQIVSEAELVLTEAESVWVTAKRNEDS